MLDEATHSAWLAGAAQGSPPDPEIVARLQFNLYINWHVQDSYLEIARNFLKDRGMKFHECIEVTRDGGKSTAINFLRLYLAEYILPFAKDPWGKPLMGEQKQMLIIGRDEEKHLATKIFPDLKSLLFRGAPWLRTTEWKAYLGADPANPDPHALRSLMNLPSKGAQRWGSTQMDLANGVSLIGLSIKQSVRGYHPLYIDVDDLLSEENSYASAEMYELLMSAHSKALVQGGLLLLSGTPQHIQDLYDLIADAALPVEGRTPQWRYRKYPAYDEDGTLGYSDKNRALLGPTHFAYLSKEDRHCLWPARLPWKLLEQDMGTTRADSLRYARERMLKRSNPETALVHEDDLLASLDTSLSYHSAALPGIHYYLGHDPSSLRKDNAGWSVVYIDTEKRILAAHFERMVADQRLPQGQGEMAVLHRTNEVCKRFAYPDWVVEKNGHQGIIAPLARLLDPSIREAVPFQVGKNKHTEAGWLGIRTVFRNKRVRLPYCTAEDRALTNQFLYELRGIQFILGEIVEDSRRKNDLVSAFFLSLKATEVHETIISGPMAFPMPSQFSQTPSQDPQIIPERHHPKGELSKPTRPQPNSLSDIRSRLARWESVRKRRP